MFQIIIKLLIYGFTSGILALGVWRTIGSPLLEGINQNAIFWELGNWIRNKAIRHEDSEVLREISCIENSTKYRRKTNWYMAAGCCLMCFSTWFGIFFVPLCFYYPECSISIIYLLPLSIAGGVVSSVASIKLNSLK